jgi:hypothetical protein
MKTLGTDKLRECFLTFVSKSLDIVLRIYLYIYVKEHQTVSLLVVLHGYETLL